MTLHLKATECHFPYEITQFYLPPNTSEHPFDFPTMEGWKAELT